MRSRKAEIGLFFLCYFLILTILLKVIPMLEYEPQAMTPLLIYQYLGNTLILTLLSALIYRGIRNKKVRKRISELQRSGNLDQYVAYVSHCAALKPRLFWVQYEKMIALAFAGRITEFYEQCASLKKQPQKDDLQRMNHLHAVFAWLNQEELSVKPVEDEKSYLDKVIRLIYWSRIGADAKSVMLLAQELLCYPCALYQSIAALILAKYQIAVGETAMAQMYFQQALDRAPSPEVHNCIMKHSLQNGD